MFLFKEIKKYDGKNINFPVHNENKPSKKFLLEYANKEMRKK